MKNTTHAWRIFSLLIIIAILGLITQRLLQPESFGEIGHYRAGSLVGILNLEQIHQGKETCAPCHDINKVHEKDVHFSVQCENCHGPGNVHIKYHNGELELISKELAVMPKEYTLEGCLFCHRKLSSRPRDFAQVDPDEHYRFLHVTDNQTRCVECHNPHEPLFLLDSVSEARIHPIIFECDHCHNEPQEKNYEDVEDHPVIFVCQDCHPAVVKDFREREHSFMRCTACHLFHRESETSGRIFKNGNKLFCLLCHEKKPFKDQNELPQIDYAEHIATMPEVMRMNPDEIGDDATVCLKCHLNFIHNSNLIKKLQEQDR